MRDASSCYQHLLHVLKTTCSFIQFPMALFILTNIDFIILFLEYLVERLDDEPASKRSKKSSHVDQLAFTLKHGSLLVMRGYTQRDWLHSVPKRAKAEAARINLTFRHVVV